MLFRTEVAEHFLLHGFRTMSFVSAREDAATLSGQEDKHQNRRFWPTLHMTRALLTHTCTWGQMLDVRRYDRKQQTNKPYLDIISFRLDDELFHVWLRQVLIRVGLEVFRPENPR